MGLLSDATSVSWNPALLGVEKGVDLLFAANYDNQFSKKDNMLVLLKSMALRVVLLLLWILSHHSL